jgi:hypothetical protein
MFKKIGLVFLAMVLIVSCGGKEVQEAGNDLSLTTRIAINDLPVIGPISLKQTQMFSGNIMRSVISASVTVGGGDQEISSIFIINLDEGNLYFVNDVDQTYVQMTFEEFDALMAESTEIRDSGMAELSLTTRDIKRNEQDKKAIGQFGECVPVDFNLILSARSESVPYQSSLKGQMWMTDAIANAELFTNFQKKSNEMFGAGKVGGNIFFGLAGIVNIDESWLKELSNAMTGIPAQAEFEINMPVENETITYGITLNLEESSTEDIDDILMSVPSEYNQVDFDEFRKY